MRLSFLSENANSSIKQFETVEDMTDFAVLTGLNGSGKTHLLKAINNGWVKIDDVSPEDVKYYNYIDFRVSNSAGVNENQLIAQQTEAWQFLIGTFRKPRFDAITTAKKTYKASFLQSIPQVDDQPTMIVDHYENLESNAPNLWGELAEDLDPKLCERIERYLDVIESQIFRNTTFQKYARSQSVIKTIKKIGKPIHLIIEQEFYAAFMPSSEGENYLSTSIGSVFTIYKIRQYRHYHDQWEMSGYLASREDLERTFTGRYETPWDIMNELLEAVHLHADNDEVFNFSITDPGNEVLKSEDVAGYIFSPKLVDNNSGEPRDFELLSSGEQVLLALAITIYESQRGFEFPKVMLLDEVDATLHPSMIRALLRTIKDVFVSRGIKVILATHAPTTIALAEADEIFVVNPGFSSNKVEHVARSQAMNLITEGYVTLDSGVAIFNEVSKQDLCILTEGHNTKIIQKAMEGLGESRIDVVSGAESRSGKDQLKVLYDFFRLIAHRTKVLFVLDVDVKDKWAEESNNTYLLRLPLNPENTLVTNGIENMFPIDIIKPFVKQIIERLGESETVIKTEFDKRRKSQFAELVVSRGTVEDFSKFVCIKEKLENIRESS